jgi:hypothetical protein
MAKWIRFELLPQNPKKKTATWYVLTISGDVFLGSIKWFGRWRAYAFHPMTDTLFEKTCLRDIADFCERATQNHRKSWK